MRTFPDLRMRSIVSGAQRAQEHLDRGEHREARDAFTEVRARACKLGLDSAYLSWGVAVTSDYLGELDVAFTTISESIAKDPLNPAAQRSFDIIAGHIRESLANPSRSPDDPSTPRLYRLLLEAGEADVACHLAMARHLAHAGEPEAAMRVVDAVTLLAPASRDAWVQKAALARAAGDEALARECESQAAALATTSVPFGIPPARGAASA
jgi:tetratricopeptide (TPR) repeat protein